MDKFKSSNFEAGTWSPSTSNIDNTSGKYEGASNPSASGMGKSSENFEGPLKPPRAPPFEFPPQLRTVSINLPPLTGEELRKACYAYAKGNVCYGSGCIRDMVFTHIQHDCVFEYILESLCEKREYLESSTPYFGQNIDGPENGTVLDPWDVPVNRPNEMVEKQVTTNIPHSSYVKQCGTCNGNMTMYCTMCNGSGKVVCKSCGGRSSTCVTCVGRGVETCLICTGTGKTECNMCKGHGKMVYSKALVVAWRPVYENIISNPGNLPKELIPKVKAKEILKEQEKVVQPVNVVPPKEINKASTLLIKRHLAFKTELIVLQRHTLQVIPFTKAKYTWRDEEGDFFVYGFEKKVYFESYPDSCCWCFCC